MRRETGSKARRLNSDLSYYKCIGRARCKNAINHPTVYYYYYYLFRSQFESEAVTRSSNIPVLLTFPMQFDEVINHRRPEYRTNVTFLIEFLLSLPTSLQSVFTRVIKIKGKYSVKFPRLKCKIQADLLHKRKKIHFCCQFGGQNNLKNNSQKLT